MAIAATAAASISSGIFCSTSCGETKKWMRPPFCSRRIQDICSIRGSSPPFGSEQYHWLTQGRGVCPSKVWIASDYSDLVPDSSEYIADLGYHPLEEVRVCKRNRDNKLTAAEIARTTIEANNSALLVFPAMVHCEPHDRISWAEFHYKIDHFGDIYIEIFNGENILLDHQASNPVNALIGMNVPMHQSTRVDVSYNPVEDGFDDVSNDIYLELVGSEVFEIPAEWVTPDISDTVHPIYFSKCLTKAVNMEMEYNKRMDHPSNGVSIQGYLRPCFSDEETYTRRLFHYDDCDDYIRDWEDEPILSISSRGDGGTVNSTFYRLEIMRIDLFSVYGLQLAVSLEDFLDAEADALVHSTSAIVKQYSERGSKCNAALKSLCKKKGLLVEAANLIGVDSLGIDVRVFHGVEVKTYRFAFKATSEDQAEKQIQQLLFPRSHRKKLRTFIQRCGDAELI
ncbi:hypothetical protein Nepgr_011513 [Nepenthes gracilis]|uniref:Uncharacterized protein n=1 Tax=Nepenthes gracilis TaxID=150966 RepID=A0AAD3XM13_NEPGR|nr:hypothetical protein Nepgr_011513 [Nepenthes gracilis]